MMSIYKIPSWYKSIIFVFFLTWLTFSIGWTRGNTIYLSKSIEKAPISDTYIASGKPNTAPSSPDLKIFWLGHNQTNGFGIERALLKFEISTQEIPVGSTIQSAKLLLTLAGTTKNDSSLNVTVNRILTEPWNENLTWNEHLSLAITPDPSTAIAIGRDFKQYEWNIKDLVQDWANTPLRIALGLRLDSDQTSGDHERNFWSKDCKDSECNASQRPRLVIQFETPTPTPANSPTLIPTPTIVPTAPPTPTPGITVLELTTDKTSEVAVGDLLSYRLKYEANSLGSYELTNIVITDAVPLNTQLITDTLQANGEFTYTYDGYTPSSVITWTLLNPLLPNEIGRVSYQVRRIASTKDTATINQSQATGTDEDNVIYNDGMDISWTYNGNRSRLRSNSTRNPPHYVYLPTINKP